MFSHVKKYQNIIEALCLPATFISTVERWCIPLAEKIAIKKKDKPNTLIIGVQGAQGSGKTTLACFLKNIFKLEHNLNCAVVSIDDFYLTQKERLHLAESIHPLFKTRGVPGTHDIELANRTLGNLATLKNDEVLRLPSFSKAWDDRLDMDQWPNVRGPIDIVILEGWCVGLQAQRPTSLAVPVNALEAKEDPEGIWRGYANRQLNGPYQTLFERLDHTVVFNIPSFDCVYEWRLQQENALKRKLQGLGASKDTAMFMSKEQVERFVSHYQRLTEHALMSMSRQGDWVLSLDNSHNITSLHSA